MEKLVQMVKKLAQKKYNKYVMGAFFASTFLMENGFFGQRHLASIADGLRMIDMNFYNTPGDIMAYLLALGQAGRANYLLLLGLDMILIVSFFLLQSTLAIKLLRGLGAVEKYEWLIFIPLLRSVMDVFETIAMAVNTVQFPAQAGWALTVAQYATPAKWVFMYLNLAVLVSLILLNLAGLVGRLVNRPVVEGA